MKFKFEITGTTPLLMHADDVEKADLLEKWRKDPKNKGVGTKGDDRTPPWTYQTYVYASDGLIVIPTDNLSVCLREAGAMMSLQGKKTFKQASQSGMMFCDDFCPLLVNGKPIKSAELDKIQDLEFDEQRERCNKLGFDLFVKRAKIGQAKHVRVRPRFNEWSLTGHVESLSKEITLDVLQEMFSLGGRYKGICDWRPSSKQSPGRFGMFDAKVVKA